MSKAKSRKSERRMESDASLTSTQQPEKSWLKFRSLEVFVVTVEENGLTAAAKRLQLSQSAVSHAIANLEAALGHQLLDRSTRPAKLTMAGSLLFARATEILTKFNSLEQLISLDLQHQLPILRIGMVDSVMASIGPQVLEKIGKHAARWRVSSATDDVSVDAIKERRVDFSITAEEFVPNDDILNVPIFREPLILVAPKEVPPEWRAIRDFAQHMDLIQYRSSSFIGKQIKDYLQKQNLRLNERYELDSSDAILAMVKAGKGWTITAPLLLLKRFSETKQACKFYPLKSPSVLRHLRVVWRRGDSSQIAEQIAEAARKALGDFLPRMREIAPWADSMKILR